MSMAWPGRGRKAVRVARLRERGGETCVASSSPNEMLCPSAALTTRLVTKSRSVSSSSCCNWQPPHEPKWRHGGTAWCGPCLSVPSPSSTSPGRSEEHTSELQSLMRISYAVFCLKKKKQQKSENNSAKLISTDRNK